MRLASRKDLPLAELIVSVASGGEGSSTTLESNAPTCSLTNEQVNPTVPRAAQLAWTPLASREWRCIRDTETHHKQALHQARPWDPPLICQMSSAMSQETAYAALQGLTAEAFWENPSGSDPPGTPPPLTTACEERALLPGPLGAPGGSIHLVQTVTRLWRLLRRRGRPEGPSLSAADHGGGGPPLSEGRHPPRVSVALCSCPGPR